MHLHTLNRDTLAYFPHWGAGSLVGPGVSASSGPCRDPERGLSCWHVKGLARGMAREVVCVLLILFGCGTRVARGAVRWCSAARAAG